MNECGVCVRSNWMLCMIGINDPRVPQRWIFNGGATYACQYVSTLVSVHFQRSEPITTAWYSHYFIVWHCQMQGDDTKAKRQANR